MDEGRATGRTPARDQGLWDIITRDMKATLHMIREDAARATILSAKHRPDHPHQKSWKKAIQREEAQADKYEAAIRSREAPWHVQGEQRMEYLEGLGLWLEI